MTENTKLEMKNISIEFPGVKALSNVNFSAESGVVHAIVGANGAGKSTLMKILGGAELGWTGEIYLNGKPVTIRNTQDAKNLGIEIVYQEVDTALALNMSIAENIMLTSTVVHSKNKLFMDWGKIYATADATLKRMGIELNVHKKARDISLAQRQMVLIARAIVEDCRILVLDEPTAPLSRKETDELFRLVRELTQNHGVAVIFISHRLPELFEICQLITIMRDGRVVHEGKLEGLTIPQIVEILLGRVYEDEYPKYEVDLGEVLFSANGLTTCKNEIHDVSFNVRSGEIIGIAGLVGAGKTELCKTLFGDIKLSCGTISLRGKQIVIRQPHEAVRYGVALVPEERRKEGVLVEESVFINLSSANLSRFCNRFPFVNKKLERTHGENIIQNLKIKTPDGFRMVKYLSGGNQQKVAVGKWFAAYADVYIFDEPTKGIDVGAKRDVFDLIGQLAMQGKCIIYVSCEFNEIMSITDRLYVMYNGTIVKELNTRQTSENEILFYSIGGSGQ